MTVKQSLLGAFSEQGVSRALLLRGFREMCIVSFFIKGPILGVVKGIIEFMAVSLPASDRQRGWKF